MLFLRKYLCTQIYRLNIEIFYLSADGVVVVDEYTADKVDQQWMTTGDLVQNRQDPNRVLDIKDEERSEGATIIAYPAHNSDNQKWIFDRV